MACIGVEPPPPRYELLRRGSVPDGTSIGPPETLDPAVHILRSTENAWVRSIAMAPRLVIGRYTFILSMTASLPRPPVVVPEPAPRTAVLVLYTPADELDMTVRV